MAGKDMPVCWKSCFDFAWFAPRRLLLLWGTVDDSSDKGEDVGDSHLTTGLWTASQQVRRVR